MSVVLIDVFVNLLLFSLRLKMYREMGFTPQEQDGSFSKMLIRKP